MSEVLLFALVPAIVLGTILYAVYSELRHNRVRRSRWELRGARARLRVRSAARRTYPAGTV